MQLTLEEKIEQIKKFLKNYEANKEKKFAIVYGPPGSGKSYAIKKAATDLNYELIIFDAENLNNLEQAARQQSLFFNKKIILIDFIEECDAKEVLKFLDKSQSPIIATTNDVWSKNLFNLRKKAQLIEFKSLSEGEIYKILIKKFGANEKLKKISIACLGDLRAALIDADFSPELSQRSKNYKIFEILDIVFKTKSEKAIFEILNKIDNIDELIDWILENLPLVYKKEELIKAFEALDKAQFYLNKSGSQWWRGMVYAKILASLGVANAKEKIKLNRINYQVPRFARERFFN